jgi:hypothetical protein
MSVCGVDERRVLCVRHRCFGKSNVEVDAWGSNGLMLQNELLICWEQLGRWRYVEASQFRSFKVSR